MRIAKNAMPRIVTGLKTAIRAQFLGAKLDILQESVELFERWRTAQRAELVDQCLE
jgi:hypothetical protein